MDSGVTHHVTNQIANLCMQSPYQSTSSLKVDDGSSVSIIEHIGSLSLPTSQPGYNVKLNNVLHVPNITKNLLSMSQFLSDNNVVIEFHCNSCLVKDLKTMTVTIKPLLTVTIK